jgi:hypothetical protein
MIDRITAHFAQQPAACISRHPEAEFHVYDQEGPHPCRHRTDEPQPTDLRVRNAGPVPVHLVAIDHCLYSSADAKRCDCALVRQDEIHFVEFKHGKFAKRAERLKECIPQLAAVINDFLQAGIIAPNSVVRAIACIGSAEQHPPQNAAIEARKLQLNLLVPSVAVELFVTAHTSFE